MLAVAERLAPDINWQRGVAEMLPFADRSFDRVFSQFGLMFFDDRGAALREMRRVMKPSGRMQVAVGTLWTARPAMRPSRPNEC